MSHRNRRRKTVAPRDGNAIKRGLGCCRSKRNVMHARRDGKREVERRERRETQRVLDAGLAPAAESVDRRRWRAKGNGGGGRSSTPPWPAVCKGANPFPPDAAGAAFRGDLLDGEE